jgi:hypothetical protein
MCQIFFMAESDLPTADADDEDRIMLGWAPRKTNSGRFTSARNGDNLTVPFECNFCVFGKMFDHVPNLGNERDVYVMGCICQIIFEGRQKWILAGCYFCICFVLSFRSPEGLMADLEGLVKFHDEESDDVVIPLLGRFKG